MGDKESYIVSFLNSKGSSLSFYVPKILDSKTPMEDLYRYYERVLYLIKEVEDLLVSLNVDKLPVNNFFNYLYLLKDIHVTEINSILNRYGYSNILDEGYREIKETIIAGLELSEANQKNIEFYIQNHLINDSEIYEYFVKKSLMRCCKLPYNVFEQLFIDYTKSKMKLYVSNPKCYVVSSQKLGGRIAYSHKEKIYLSKEEMMKLHSMGTYAVIKNMLHEVAHVKQYRDIHLIRKSDEFILKEIKEEILASYYPNYYETNYENISYEVEAELTAITEILKLFKKFSIRFKNNENPYVNAINNMIANINSDERKTADGLMSINELFDNVIMYHPELLSIYPQLNSDYEIGYDDLVIRKDDFGRGD